MLPRCVTHRRDEKESLAVRSAQEGDDSTKGCVDRDERRLADLGRRAVESFALSHILFTRVEAAFAEAECVKMQDALIREEEELEREEVCGVGMHGCAHLPLS